MPLSHDSPSGRDFPFHKTLLGERLPLSLDLWRETALFTRLLREKLPFSHDFWERNCPFRRALHGETALSEDSPWGERLPLSLDFWERLPLSHDLWKRNCPFLTTSGRETAPLRGLSLERLPSQRAPLGEIDYPFHRTSRRDCPFHISLLNETTSHTPSPHKPPSHRTSVS